MAAAAALVFTASGGATPGGLAVTDLNTPGVNAAALANALVGAGGGITVTGVSYVGDNRAGGTFTNGAASIGSATGVVLGTGHVQTRAGDDLTPDASACTKGVEGPNQCHEIGGSAGTSLATSTTYNRPGDAQLTALAGFATNDAAVLQLSFVPQYPTIQFKYVFGSEEYNDWSNTRFNDVFAFYVNGVNCALVPGTAQPVSINTINGGNTSGQGSGTAQNPALFRDNVRPIHLDTELDGLTTVLTCSAQVNPGVSNVLKLAIADGSDTSLDSAVFIEGGSLISGTQISTTLSDGVTTGNAISVPAGSPATDSAHLVGANASAATGSVAYTVYSDAACTVAAASGGTKTVTGGAVPDSDPVVLNTPGTYYWRAAYSGDAGNNAVTSGCGDEVETVTIPARSVSVGDASATEGGDVTFTLTLDQPAVVPVTVDYATADGTATAPADYASATGTATFAAGESTVTVTVGTAGDSLDESDETFTLALGNAVNATISDGTGVGTIVDNDPPPSVSIGNATVTEGNSGSTPATFTVTLSTASGQTVTVDWSTHDGTAAAGSDYTAASGTVTFAAGTTTQTVSVDVLGDAVYEGNEAFTVTLSNPSNVTIADGTGDGTIVDDDNRPPTCSVASASPGSLWPPNHKLVTITVSGCTDPDAGDTVSVQITGVQQDEPINGAGDGDTSPDAAWVAGHPNQVQVRSERSGTGNGRVYVISFRATDSHGASTTGTVRVGVPHNVKDTAVDSGPRYNSFG
jgi:hypothetical protein